MCIVYVHVRIFFLISKGIELSPTHVRRLRRQLGWRYTKRRDVQLVHDRNKPARLQFARECVARNDQFNNVVFTDECSVMLETTPARAFEKV